MTREPGPASHRTPEYMEHIRRVVDAAPPLTPEQRAVIRTVFTSTEPHMSRTTARTKQEHPA